MQTMAYRRALEEREQKKKEREAESMSQFKFPETDALDDATARAIQAMNQPYQASPMAEQLFPNVFNRGKK